MDDVYTLALSQVGLVQVYSWEKSLSQEYGKAYTRHETAAGAWDSACHIGNSEPEKTVNRHWQWWVQHSFTPLAANKDIKREEVLEILRDTSGV